VKLGWKGRRQRSNSLSFCRYVHPLATCVTQLCTTFFSQDPGRNEGGGEEERRKEVSRSGEENGQLLVEEFASPASVSSQMSDMPEKLNREKAFFMAKGSVKMLKRTNFISGRNKRGAEIFDVDRSGQH
jgi:hypothetical protein